MTIATQQSAKPSMKRPPAASEDAASTSGDGGGRKLLDSLPAQRLAHLGCHCVTVFAAAHLTFKAARFVGKPLKAQLSRACRKAAHPAV